MMFDAINRFADTMANTVEKFKGVRESAEGKTEEIDKCIQAFNESVEQAKAHKLKAKDKSIQEIYDASTKVLKDTLDGLTKELEEARNGMQFIQDNEDSLNVVVFGKVKAGKSYLGNLMMGNAIRKLSTKTSYDRLEQPKVEVYDQGTCTTQDKLKEVTEENDASGGFGVDNREATCVIQLFHLGAMTWVDTPGFGSVTNENQELAREYVKNADLVIFPSTSDAAGTKQDFQEMKKLCDMGKRCLLVVTQSDTLEEDCDDDGNIVQIPVPKSDDDRRSTENYMKETLKKHGIKLGDENIELIAKVLPQVSEQVIIFMLKKDWEYTKLDPYVGSRYYIDKKPEESFGSGKRNSPVQLYYALDWEKVSKNRKCCVEGWERIQSSANHMFSHAVTLEILNQHKFSGVMLDYISLQEYIEKHPDRDEVIASEIEKAEKAYTACVGDYKKFEQIPYTSEKAKTDIAIRHLYKCVEEQFLNTDRKRANQFYNEKFIEFCKIRWVKNRRKSGLVLNLTERDIIFLTKISIKGKDKIRLIDLYKEYEYRGIFLDNTSKEYLQDFFTKLNLIDKKSDSGDAQYVKRIL